MSDTTRANFIDTHGHAITRTIARPHPARLLIALTITLPGNEAANIIRELIGNEDDLGGPMPLSEADPDFAVAGITAQAMADWGETVDLLVVFARPATLNRLSVPAIEALTQPASFDQLNLQPEGIDR